MPSNLKEKINGYISDGQMNPFSTKENMKRQDLKSSDETTIETIVESPNDLISYDENNTHIKQETQEEIWAKEVEERIKKDNELKALQLETLSKPADTPMDIDDDSDEIFGEIDSPNQSKTASQIYLEQLNEQRQADLKHQQQNQSDKYDILAKAPPIDYREEKTPNARSNGDIAQPNDDSTQLKGDSAQVSNQTKSLSITDRECDLLQREYELSENEKRLNQMKKEIVEREHRLFTKEQQLLQYAEQQKKELIESLNKETLKKKIIQGIEYCDLQIQSIDRDISIWKKQIDVLEKSRQDIQSHRFTLELQYTLKFETDTIPSSSDLVPDKKSTNDAPARQDNIA